MSDSKTEAEEALDLLHTIRKGHALVGDDAEISWQSLFQAEQALRAYIADLESQLAKRPIETE